MTDITLDITPMQAIIEAEPEHADVPYFFATKKGWYSNVPTLYGTAHVPAAKTPPTLPEVKTTFVPNENRVPAFIFDQFIDLARKVYDKHKTEVTSYICRNDNGKYSLFIPHQYVTGASVNHKVEPGEMKKRLPVGTIHSHCMMSAFHSGTDAHDMGKMPGVHATIGMVMNDEPEYAVAIAVGETAFDIEAHDIIDEDNEGHEDRVSTAPDSWMNFIHVGQSAPWHTGGITTTYKRPQTAGFQYRPPGPVQNYGGFGMDWMDESWGTPLPDGRTGQYKYDPDRDESMELMHTENNLYGEAYDLAQMGYRLQYTITKDEKAAKEWLEHEHEKYSAGVTSDD